MPRQAFSDAQILRALQDAARRCGQPLSHGRYDAVARDVAGPSSARIIQRFGTWGRACAAAGVTSTAPGRSYRQRWDEQAVTEAVADYLRSPGSPGSFAGYQQWARGRADRPSGATVRNVLGGWSAAKAAAGG